MGTLTCTGLVVLAAISQLRPDSRNTLIFVESDEKGHEWEPYRLVEAQSPVSFAVQGPGRLLLSMRTVAGGEDPVAVVFRDATEVLTAKVPAVADERARFANDSTNAPSAVALFLVTLRAGQQRVVIRHSSGAPVLVSARYSSREEMLDVEEGEIPLVAPPSANKPDVPNVGHLPSADDVDAGGPPDAEDADWRMLEPEPDEVLEPRTGPKRSEDAVDLETTTRAKPSSSRLTVRAPWFLFEIRGGAQFNQLGLSVAPVVGMEARVPIPSLDARAFSIGVSAAVAHSQGEREVLSQGSIISVAGLRHTAFTADLGLRWAFLRDAALAPYLGLGAGAMFGTMRTELGERVVDAGTRGFIGTAVLGSAFGEPGHRPYVEARVEAGSISSDLLSSAASHFAVNLMVGYRFEFLTDALVD